MKASIAVAVFIIACCVKLLLLPSYHSTDFEVHRNWLAITHSLPVSEWYFDDTSEWTLDYPPFFAYFELALAQIARFVDPHMLEVDNVDYKSELTVLFMRGSVIATDTLLVIAAYLFVNAVKMPETTQLAVFVMIVFNAGLLLVDHIHFQYNGVLMGLLVLCAYCAVVERYALLAACYSVLVLMKHLFAPLAPIFGVFLISRFCFVKNSLNNTATSSKNGSSSNKSSTNSDVNSVFSVARFAKLVSIAVLALAAAFGPFLAQTHPTEQLTQIASRLFPFGRGLVHAYWAPNVWALYCGADKVLYYAIKKLNNSALNTLLRTSAGSTSSTVHVVHDSTSGIVGDFAFAVLPSVSATVCLVILLVSLLPAVYTVYRRPTPKVLLHALVYASLSSFMCGYHVHEKAVLVPLLLQSLAVYGDSGARDLVGSVSGVDVSTSSSSSSSSSSGKNDMGANSSSSATKDSVTSTDTTKPASLSIPPIEPPTPPTTSSTANSSNTTNTTPTIAHTLVASAIHVRSGRVLMLSKIVFGVLGIVGTYSLFPLFYTLPELFTKTAIYVAFVCGMNVFLFHTEHTGNKMDSDLNLFLGSCVVSMVALFVFCELLHPSLFYDAALRTTALAFLPRMLTSLVCALYLCVAWAVSALILFSV